MPPKVAEPCATIFFNDVEREDVAELMCEPTLMGKLAGHISRVEAKVISSGTRSERS